MPLGSSPTVKGPASGQSISLVPNSAVQVPPVARVEIKGDGAAVTQSAPSQQIPVSKSLCPVVNGLHAISTSAAVCAGASLVSLINAVLFY